MAGALSGVSGAFSALTFSNPSGTLAGSLAGVSARILGVVIDTSTPNPIRFAVPMERRIAAVDRDSRRLPVSREARAARVTPESRRFVVPPEVRRITAST
jgi:hypothetical protein